MTGQAPGPRRRTRLTIGRVKLLLWGAAAVAVVMTTRLAVAAGEDIRDIHGALALPGPRPRWWLGALVGAGVVVVVTLALARHRRRPLSPYARALAELQAERALVSEHPQTAREFSIAVSETVRRYVEEAFPVRAAHRTTDELLADLMKDTSPVARQRTELAAFLRACDLAKFAGWMMEAPEMFAMLDSAEAFVQATRPADKNGARPLAVAESSS